MSAYTLPQSQSPVPARGRWWTNRAGYLAAAWAALSGVLALVWTISGSGYPYGTADPQGTASLLRFLPPDVGALVFAGLTITVAVAALAMSGPQAVRLRGVARVLLVAYCGTVVAFLLVVVPDVQVLTTAGYLPMLIIGAPFGWPPVDYAEVFTWSLGNKVWAMAGGILLARTVLTWLFRTGGACLSCGRSADGPTWTSAESAARWGRWATYLAAAIPLLYAATRFAWLANIPLGVSPEFLREMWDTGLVWAGGGLAAFAVVGAVLTLGLVQRWGERFPRWMIGLSGRRVPIMLAVVPATLVAIAVTAGGLAMYSLPEVWDFEAFSFSVGPALLWPLWGVALGAAALAYHLRRRGGCSRCSRDD
ncbi:hypothetical protein GCM10027290_07410 [Micromonospora sonneratiae]|uniref:Uncharacterized protein n=1 Tax=Micromonospora sonneratiae TaxID=1184706 RepID=A0ABW3YB78_9ACTN